MDFGCATSPSVGSAETKADVLTRSSSFRLFVNTLLECLLLLQRGQSRPFPCSDASRMLSSGLLRRVVVLCEDPLTLRVENQECGYCVEG